MDTTYLDSLSLSPETRQQIDTELASLRDDQKASVILKIRKGKRLLTLKALIGHGGWLDWLILNANVGYRSARTPEREMHLAEHLYERIPEIERLQELTSISALYELCRERAPEEALNAALSMMGQGVEVTKKMAGQLTAVYECSSTLGDRVRDNAITLADAESVAAALRDVPADVKALVIDSGVRDAGVVSALAAMKPEQLAEVQASGTLYNPLTQEPVPLAKASAADAHAAVNVDEAEREARRQEYIRQWRAGKPERLARVVGRREDVLRELADVLPFDGSVVVIVYPETSPEPVT